MLVIVSMELLRQLRKISTGVVLVISLLLGVSSIFLNNASGLEAKKIVYLSFDDGPHPIFTPLLLALLDEHGAKATFFPIGHRLEERWESDDLHDLLNRGHALGNHSWTHRDLTKESKENLYFQLDRTSKQIESMTGFRPNCFRAPFGERNNNVLAVAEELGMKHVAWTIDPQEWREPSIEEAMEHISEKFENGAILLLHDRRFLTLPILHEVLKRFPSSEWDYRTIPECKVDNEKTVRSTFREKDAVPVGNVTEVVKISENFKFSGWGYDPDMPEGGLQINLSANSNIENFSFETNSDHEFTFEIPDFEIGSPVCLWLENEGLLRHNTFLGCHNAS